MSRKAAAAELQDLIEQMHALCARGARLAEASGGLVNPSYFRGAASAMTMAAGDLDQKGLLQPKVPA